MLVKFSETRHKKHILYVSQSAVSHLEIHVFPGSPHLHLEISAVDTGGRVFFLAGSVRE